MKSILKSSPLWFASRMLLLTFVAILIFLVGRGLVAWNTGVFFENDVKKKISTVAREKLELYSISLARQRAQCDKIDSAINSSMDNASDLGQIYALVQSKKQLLLNIKESVPPIKIEPFYLGNTMLLWPWLFTCLFWLVFLFKPPRLKSSFYARNWRLVLVLTVLVFILYRIPTYLRNFISSDSQRVFAAVNYNISRVGFYNQEIILFLFILIVSIIWIQWNEHYCDVRKEMVKQQKCLIKKPFDFSIKFLNSISKNFIRWQMTSLVLFLGFIYYSTVFWKNIVASGDQRYLLSAILIHLIWAITWGVITVPMVVQWYFWNLLKSKVRFNLVNDTTIDADQKKEKLAVIQSLAPIETWNLAGSSVAALAGFLFPIVNAFIR